MARISYDAVKSAALNQINSLAPRLLPEGRRIGNWWVARCPWRNDRRPSLHLSLTTSHYKDFASPDTERGGSILDLVCRLDGCDLPTAAATLASLCGLTDADAARRPKRPEPPPCATCRHRWLRFPAARHAHCTVVVVPMVEEPVLCTTARRLGWACGPVGRLHVARD